GDFLLIDFFTQFAQRRHLLMFAVFREHDAALHALGGMFFILEMALRTLHVSLNLESECSKSALNDYNCVHAQRCHDASIGRMRYMIREIRTRQRSSIAKRSGSIRTSL